MYGARTVERGRARFRLIFRSCFASRFRHIFTRTSQHGRQTVPAHRETGTIKLKLMCDRETANDLLIHNQSESYETGFFLAMWAAPCAWLTSLLKSFFGTPSR